MSTRRNLARPGLSYTDANKGRLITIEDDVLGIKRQIEETWPELRVVFDNVDEVWVVIQTDYDGRESLAAETDRLDQRLLDILHKADQTRPGYDAVKQVDDWNARIQAVRDREYEERMAALAERLAFAFKKDGMLNHAALSNNVGAKVDQRRVIRSRTV